MPPSGQREGVEARLRAVEERTGTQIVVAVVDRADLYHGLRWRAFAFGSALAGAAVVLVAALRPAWVTAEPAFAAVGTVLGSGLAFALAATFLPAFARLFLEPLRAEGEARRYAESVFLERELFATRARTAVLLLVGRFERQVVVLPDVGLRGRVTDAEWRRVASAIASHVRAGRETDGLIAGLDALEGLLTKKGFTARDGAVNELPDRLVTGGGA